MITRRRLTLSGTHDLCDRSCEGAASETDQGTQMESNEACFHLTATTSIKHAKRPECDECVKIGGRWVDLRTCTPGPGSDSAERRTGRH